MTSSTQPPINNGTPQGLPPVKPPSGRFIIQLFLIPALIVACLVFVFLALPFMFGSLALMDSESHEKLLANLDNTNPDIRWRAAHQLSQVLRKPESLELASDPDFAAEIAVRLRKANDELNRAELKAQAELAKKYLSIDAQNLKPEEVERLKKEADVAAWDQLRAQRDLVRFLTGCAGSFNIPVAVPVLRDIARMNEGTPIESLSLRKRLAVLALATLGNNMKIQYYGVKAAPDIKVLSSEQKAKILDKLARASNGPEGDERTAMARYCLAVLKKEMPSGVDKLLAECANHEDIFLRAEVGFALNFWDGDLVEPTLLRLAQDKGVGKRYLDPDSN